MQNENILLRIKTKPQNRIKTHTIHEVSVDNTISALFIYGDYRM